MRPGASRAGLFALGVVLVLGLELALASSAAAGVSKAKVLYRATAAAAETTFFDRAGLQLAGSCAAGGETAIAVRSSTDDAMLFINGQGQEGPAAFGTQDVGAGTEFNLLTVLGLDGGFDAGQIIFSRLDGRHVTIDWSAYERTPFPGESQCAFWGIATIAGRGGKQSQRRVIDFRAVDGREKTVLDAKGLRLRASCLGGRCRRRPHRCRPRHPGVDSQELSEHYAGDENLGRGERFNLFPRLGSTGQLDTGELIYANPKGSVVSVDWLARSNGAYGGQRHCAFVGTARVLGKGARDRAFFAAGGLAC